MDSEVRPYDDEAGFGPWTGEDPGSRGSGWLPGNGSPGRTRAGPAPLPRAGRGRGGRRPAGRDAPARPPGDRVTAGCPGDRGLGGAAQRAVHAQADPPGEPDLPDREGTLRPEIRLQAAGWHRVLCQPPRRDRLPGLCPQVRAAGRGPVRRAQLRGLVQPARHDRAHGGRDRDELVQGRERPDGPGRHRPAPDRPVQPAGRARPGRAGRLLPHGGRGRPHPRRRGRGAGPGLRADQRRPRVGADRHRRRHGPHLQRVNQQRPVLGLPRRRWRQLRHRHRVHVPHPPAVPAGGVLPVLALVTGGQGGGGLAILGALPARRPVVQPAHVGVAARRDTDHPGRRHLPGQRGGCQRLLRSCTPGSAPHRPGRSWPSGPTSRR